MLAGTTDEVTNVKVGFRRPQRGKLRSSKEVDETKYTSTEVTGLKSPRPRATEPCGEGSWPALICTAIYDLFRQHTMASRKRCLGARPHSERAHHVCENWVQSTDQSQMVQCSLNCTNVGKESSFYQHKLLSRIITILSNHTHLNLCHRY